MTRMVTPFLLLLATIAHVNGRLVLNLREAEFANFTCQDERGDPNWVILDPVKNITMPTVIIPNKRKIQLLIRRDFQEWHLVCSVNGKKKTTFIFGKIVQTIPIRKMEVHSLDFRPGQVLRVCCDVSADTIPTEVIFCSEPTADRKIRCSLVSKKKQLNSNKWRYCRETSTLMVDISWNGRVIQFGAKVSEKRTKKDFVFSKPQMLRVHYANITQQWNPLEAPEGSRVRVTLTLMASPEVFKNKFALISNEGQREQIDVELKPLGGLHFNVSVFFILHSSGSWFVEYKTDFINTTSSEFKMTAIIVDGWKIQVACIVVFIIAVIIIVIGIIAIRSNIKQSIRSGLNLHLLPEEQQPLRIGFCHAFEERKQQWKNFKDEVRTIPQTPEWEHFTDYCGYFFDFLGYSSPEVKYLKSITPRMVYKEFWKIFAYRPDLGWKLVGKLRTDRYRLERVVMNTLGWESDNYWIPPHIDHIDWNSVPERRWHAALEEITDTLAGIATYGSHHSDLLSYEEWPVVNGSGDPYSPERCRKLKELLRTKQPRDVYKALSDNSFLCCLIFLALRNEV